MPAGCKLVMVCMAAALAASDAAAQTPQRRTMPRTERAPRSPFTHDNVDRAWEASKASKRPLLLFVSTSDCYYCEKMERDTYSHPEIARTVRTVFVTAKMKKKSNPELVQKMGVRAFPTTLVISPEGDLIARVEGYADPKKFVQAVRPVLAKYAQRRGRSAVHGAELEGEGAVR